MRIDSRYLASLAILIIETCYRLTRLKICMCLSHGTVQFKFVGLDLFQLVFKSVAESKTGIS